MSTRLAYLCTALLVAVVALPASGDWEFNSVYTLKPADGFDGRIYDPMTGGLVKDGALVQFVVALDGMPFVDPLDHFDYNQNGVIDLGGAEHVDMSAWVNFGADPADISGGTNILCSNGGFFTGEFELQGGAMDWSHYDEGLQDPPVIVGGMACDLIAMRVWNMTKAELEALDLIPTESVWYLTDREFGTCLPEEGGGEYAPDSGWCVGMGWIPPGADPTFYGWHFQITVGAEEYIYGRRLDRCLCAAVPEPGLVGVLAAAAIILLLRKRT